MSQEIAGGIQGAGNTFVDAVAAFGQHFSGVVNLCNLEKFTI
jgi:hypothetical protein